MEGAVEIPENLNSNPNQQDSTQMNVETDSTATTTTESQNVNQPQQTDAEPIKSQNDNAYPTEPSAEILSKNVSDEQKNPAEDQNTQHLDSNTQENQKEPEGSNLQENVEENKQPEKAKGKNKKKNNATENNGVSEERKEQVMSYVKALMGMHYMKNDGVPAEVLPGFYLGSIGAAFNKKLLEENKIGHILCCCDGVKQAYPQLFKYKMLKLMDKPTEDITRYFEEASDFIHDILTRGEKVLVHCFAGKSRSTTIMISYLIKHHNMSVDEAIALIRSKRSVIQPNLGFVAQLRAYEKKLKEKLEQVEKSE